MLTHMSKLFTESGFVFIHDKCQSCVQFLYSFQLLSAEVFEIFNRVLFDNRLQATSYSSLEQLLFMAGLLEDRNSRTFTYILHQLFVAKFQDFALLTSVRNLQTKALLQFVLGLQSRLHTITEINKFITGKNRQLSVFPQTTQLECFQTDKMYLQFKQSLKIESVLGKIPKDSESRFEDDSLNPDALNS